MATIDLTQETWSETVSSGTVFVDFWATWCGPCRSFAPVYERVSEAHPDIVFAKVDTEDQQALAGAFQITSIPTLMVFRDNILLFSQAGALAQPQMEELVRRVQELDMDDIRKKIAEQEASSAVTSQPEDPNQNPAGD